ncbi:helix-turn-helix domain-containing protein [Candidatus Paracaedibacter symbiosus]|uniref:helix-turn-helix domain-containing protein n=1 Tax=Candidatus Paracaedibacter symbiosus TaxID=244582 RepID=UPI00068D45D8|nr:helix-turn-helix transcriptional regulator [Candidatus Paracaedibacter symbiosus]
MTNKTTDILYGDSSEEVSKISDSVLNKIVGTRLKDRRQLMGLNQAELGRRLHISGQQIHKYEAGIDQLSASKIYELSGVLQIPVSYFFDELESHHLAESESSDYQPRDPEEIRLQKYINIYKDFSEPKLQKMLFEVTRLFAAQLRLLEFHNGKTKPPPRNKVTKSAQ